MAITSNDIGLLFTVKGDTSQGSAAIADFRKRVTADLDAVKNSGTSGFGALTQSAEGLQKGAKDAASEVSNLLGIFTGNRLTGITSQVTSFSSALSAIPGAAGLAVGAIAGVATAVVTATVAISAAIFKMSQDASEFGSQIHDMAQKTGLSTEAISSLKVAADQSGTSIETISRGLKNFTLLMAQAASGSKDAQKTLKDLGVTSSDLTTAFGQAVQTIEKLPAGMQQNDAAAAAFGKRLGGELIPLIDQFHGDLPGLIAENERLGLAMNQSAADAADKFGDQMDTLDKQIKGITRTIGIEFMGAFTDMAHSTSEWLARNKGEFQEWAEAEAKGLYGLIGYWKDLTKAAEDYGNEIVDLRPIDQNQGFFGWVARHSLPRLLASRGEEEQKSQPATATLGGSADAAYTDQEAQEKQKEEEEKAYKERLASLGTFYAAIIDQARQAYTTQLAMQIDYYKTGGQSEEQFRVNLKKMYEGYLAFVSDKINKQEEIETAQAKNDVDRDTAHAKRITARAALEAMLNTNQANAEKVIEDQHKKTSQQEEKDFKAQTDLINRQIEIWKDYGKTVQDVLAQVNSDLDKWNKLNQESAALQSQNLGASRDLIEFRAEQQRKILENTLDFSTGGARLQALQALRDFDIKEADRQRQQRINDLNAEQQAALDRIKGKENEEEQKIEIEDLYDKKRLLTEEQFQAALLDIKKKFAEQATVLQGENAAGGLFGGLAEGLGTSIDNMIAQVQPLVGIGNLIGNAFQTMAQGVGAAIKAFVLFGSTGTTFRKFAAEVIASVAQMAAVQAIWEAAQALAMAALFWFTGNPKFLAASGAHTGAAILYGTIAGIAAVAGRALAGDAFKQESGSAYGSAGAAAGTSGTGGQGSGDTSGQGKAYSSYGDDTQIVETGRNAPFGNTSPATVHVVVQFNDKSMLEVVKTSIQKGSLRDVVLDTASAI